MIIRSEEIYKKANSIVRSCGTRDTLKIARELGIYVHYIDTLNDLLGMYTYRHKERHILLNSGMEHMVMQMVCGHEIGHDVFHRDLAKKGNALPEFTLFDMRSKPEYEANAFAAHLIIDNDELVEYMQEGYDVVQLSAMMGTNINLMLIKLNEMYGMGIELALCPSCRLFEADQTRRMKTAILDVLRTFLSDKFIIWDACCRNQHNPVMRIVLGIMKRSNND